MAGGYDVAISGSGPAERIELIVEVLAPGARALSTDEVVKYAGLIVLAIPMHRFRELRRDLFAGKILVDAMNYWDEIDGVEAGRLAYLAGRMPKKIYASASSPNKGLSQPAPH